VKEGLAVDLNQPLFLVTEDGMPTKKEGRGLAKTAPDDDI
jgi:hypothetical protein